MSTDTPGSSSEGGPQWLDREKLRGVIREHYDEHGVPPTRQEAGERAAGVSKDYYSRVGLWPDTVRDVGVPAADDLVAEYLRQRYRDRYPWQEFVAVLSSDISEETGLSAERIGHVKRRFEDPGGLEAVLGDEWVVEPLNTASHPKWRVERDDGGEES